MKKHRNIMIQGTASSVGKSLLVAALCRIFKQAGEKVAPFKSQNMALNSFVTKEGKEMGRAQVVQAEAAGVEPHVLMNPILLKPTSDKKAQIILNGEVYNNLDAVEYHTYKAEARTYVEAAYQKLSEQYDLIVLEGAGSPAEINLRENDLVNMGMAEIADAPVILVGDIDKGGVFASIVGTLFLLNEEEKKRVKGVIINKFRGDVELLKPGIKMLENIIKIPVLGVIPYKEFYIEEEDSVTERFIKKRTDGEIEVAVIRLPYMSNYTDFDVFKIFEDVKLLYINKLDELNDPDMIIIPGSKNTIADMSYLKNKGFAEKIYRLNRADKLIIGICGGYQMLGQVIEDPNSIESNQKSCNGLGLLDIKTVLKKAKTLEQKTVQVNNSNEYLKKLGGQLISGYEIHMGETSGTENYQSLTISENREQGGVVAGNVIGTYLHGFFDNADFTRGLLNNLREKRGLESLDNSQTYEEFKEQQFDFLAETVSSSLNMQKIKQIIDEW